jgi:hypothetical protein
MTAPTARPSPRPRPRSRLRTWLIALAVLVIPALLFTLYLGLMFSWSYSDGDRAGILQKFSHKGWICKSYEGELAMTTTPGVAPVIWDFSTRDKAVVPKLNAALGKRVVLHYKEHRGIPTTCFGQTGYFVDSVSVQQ